MGRLSAEIIARAIVAAARVYGVPPLEACAVGQTRKRAPIIAAAVGLRDSRGVPVEQLQRILGFGNASLSRLQQAHRRGQFDRARKAASLATRPSAAEVQAWDAARIAAVAERNARRRARTLELQKVQNDKRRAARQAARAAIAAATANPVRAEPLEPAAAAPDLEAWCDQLEAQKSFDPPAAQDPPPAPPTLAEPEHAVPRRAGPRTLTAVATRREVELHLLLHPATVDELVEGLNLREPALRQALRELAEQGLAKVSPLTAEGWRAQTWSAAV